MKVLAATLLYNTPDLAACTLEQLPQVILVENGSTDTLPPGDHTSLSLGQRYSFSAGWNRAMDRLLGLDDPPDYVWMLNSDLCWLSRTMQDGLAHYLDTHAACMAVTPSFNSPHGTFWSRGGGARVVSWIDWCGPLVRLDDWVELGGFDERLPGYYADIDLCVRARRAGKTLAVLDDYVMNHLGGQTAIRTATPWDANDAYLVSKWGRHWNELI